VKMNKQCLFSVCVSARARAQGEGFISINKLVEEGRSISVSHKAIEESLIKLAHYGLILLNTRSKTDLNGASHFKITECGSYFLHVLVMRFSYVDLVLADTPIADVDVALKIRHMLSNRELDIRFNRVSLFINYLLKMEKKEFDSNPEIAFSKLGKYKFARAIMSSFANERKYIRGRIREKLMFLDDIM